MLNVIALLKFLKFFFYISSSDQHTATDLGLLFSMIF